MPTNVIVRTTKRRVDEVEYQCMYQSVADARAAPRLFASQIQSTEDVTVGTSTAVDIHFRTCHLV